jgi:predicted MFS family arabinose efflux permease
MALASLPAFMMGVMIKPIEQEFGWSRAEITSGPMIYSVAAVPLGPLLGWAVDRFGPRRIAIVGVLITSVAYALFAATTASIWSWWALWGLFAIIATPVKPVVWAAGVSSFFFETRGLALAVMLCGTAVCSTLVPGLTNHLVESHGWRATFVAMSGIWALVIFPPVLFFFRGAADAKGKRGARTSTAAPVQLPGLPPRQALMSWRHLRLQLASIAVVLGTVTCGLSLVPILESLGHTRAAAAQLAGIIGITSILGRLVGGYLLDRLNANAVAAFMVALPVATCVILLALPASLAAAAVAIVILGLAMGTELDAVAYLTARHFGLRSFGVLYGTISGIQALSTGLGPFIVNFIYDITKSYQVALELFIPVNLLGAAMFLSLGRFPEFRAPEETLPAQ